jgi:nicotinamidase/pyrazinamidase
MKSVLLIIDMLNDFVRPDGALPVPGAESIIPNIKRLKEGMATIYVNDLHSLNDPEFEEYPPHAVARTEGAEIVDELEPSEYDMVVDKTTFDGFSNPNLATYIKTLDPFRVYITGVATEICVMETAISCARHFLTTVVVDAVKGLEMYPGSGLQAAFDMGMLDVKGDTTEEIIQAHEGGNQWHTQ